MSDILIYILLEIYIKILNSKVRSILAYETTSVAVGGVDTILTSVRWIS